MNKLQWNFNQNTKLFIHENASEKIVCEMVAILSRGRWVNNTQSMERFHKISPGILNDFIQSTKGIQNH